MEASEKSLSVAQKLAGTGCALSAIYLLPVAAAQAADVDGAGSLGIDLGDSNVYWDVDGNGSDDFVLNGDSYYYGGSVNLDSAEYGSPLGGQGLVQRGEYGVPSRFNNLPQGFMVGPSLATGYDFGSSNQSGRTVVWASSYAGVSTGYPAVAGGFGSGDDQYFGFAFERNGNTHYGWAEINIRTSDSPFGFDIVRWCYNDVPDAPVTVGQCGPEAIPVASLPFLGLTLLGLGGVGLRELRRRRKKAA